MESNFSAKSFSKGIINRVLKRKTQSKRKDKEESNHHRKKFPAKKMIAEAIIDCGSAVIQKVVDSKLVPGLSTSKPKNDKSVQAWMIRARKFQQANYNSLGDRVWDVLSDADMLERKIGFAMFGLPEDNSDGTLIYDKEKTEFIIKVKDHIIDLWNNVVSKSIVKPNGIYFACIFVHMFAKFEAKDSADVLFKVPKRLTNLKDDRRDDCYFLDSNCRTYEGWDDYLGKNKLPKCHMCYPLRGTYTATNDMVEIGFKKSPACDVIEAVLTGLDVTTSVLAVGGIALNFASLAVPVAAPIVWASTATMLASSAYDVSRNVSTLVDIGSHKGNLGFNNPESRNAWLGLATSAVGAVTLGGSAVARGLAVSEKAISQGGVIAMRIINISSIAISGLGIINSLITIVVKFLNGSLTPKDILQFTSACQFFLNAVVSQGVANKLIAEIASSDMTNIFHTTTNCVFNYAKKALDFTDFDSFNLLKILVLGYPLRMVPDIEIYEIERDVLQVVELIDLFVEGKINMYKLSEELFDVLDNIWFKYKSVIVKATDELCKVFKIRDWKHYIVKSGYKPFLNASPDIARQFCLAINETVSYCNLDDTIEEYIKSILDLINDVTESHTSDFLNKTKHVCECVTKEFDNVKEQIGLNMDLVKINSEDSDKNVCPIEVNKSAQWFRTTIGKLRTESSLQEILSSYTPVNNNPKSSVCEVKCMETNTSNHYVFSSQSGSKVLPEHEYWQKASDISNVNLNKNNATIYFTQSGVALIKPNNSNCKIKAVVFYSFYERKSVLYCMTVIKKQSC